jgi:sigma-54 dependent transcriptional regulator, acetoin dehydrogenase operon transcriptional activator AcoR
MTPPEWRGGIGGSAMSHQPEPHADRVFRVAKHDPSPYAAGTAPVDLSWRRCLNQFHLDPAHRYQPVVLDSVRLRELHERHADLVQIARAEMDQLYEQIAASGYALLLADTSGIILCERVDPVIKKSFERAGLMVGAEWSEEREGTNGIGTCVTERRPITIHQADHFRAQHIGLSCSAAPIRDPFGNVVAVLDASSCSAPGGREQQSHTVALVNASAGLIEKCLFLRRYRGETILRFHRRPEFVDLLHDGALAVAGDGTIVAADAAASRLLSVKDYRELVGRPFTELFDARCEELRHRADSGQRAVWEMRARRHGERFFASVVRASEPLERPRAPRSSGLPTLVQVAEPAVSAELTLEEIAGEDPQMVRNLHRARRVLDGGIAVLLIGPTGSGKEAFAKAMHAASARARRPFVALNCAAIPEQLIESELFGYSAGAFTGARREGMRGCVVQSSGGTLFLDEIGDMPLALQTRLLRVLEDQQVRPLGTDAATTVELHVISASNRNLRELVAAGKFREDLYYRLNGITLEMPALAKRRDKESVIRKCIARESCGTGAATVELEALDCLVRYDWPGNVRELRNVVRTALAISDDRVIRPDDLPNEVRNFEIADTAATAAPATEHPPPRADADRSPLERAERQALLATIERNEWNMTRAAAQLGLSRATLYRKLRQHEIGVGRVRRVQHYLDP